MLTKMEVLTSQGNLLTVQLGDISNGIEIRDISGLDPVKATLSSSPFANQDGEVYQSSRRGSRNITMKLGLVPDPTVTDVLTLRRSVYSYFRPKSEVTLIFYADDTDDLVEDGYHIVGRVEYCQSPMFTQDPEVDISIICYDPDFVDPVSVSASGITSIDLAPTHFSYVGTVETGFTLTIGVAEAISEFTVSYKDPSNVTWTMDVAIPLLVGDTVKIVTVPGSKEASLIRAGVTSSMLYAVSPQSAWPQFSPGDNYVQLLVTGDTSPAALTATLAYFKRFGEL